MAAIWKRESKEPDPTRVSLFETAPERDSSPSATPKSLRWLLRPGKWLYEILALFIAGVGFIAVTGILLKYNGKPNPKWSLHLTLNTIVSLVSTLFRFCILFAVSRCIGQAGWLSFAERRHRLDDHVLYDAAGRGPLGSTQLLIHTRASQFICVGALITLVAIAVEPAFQQTVSYTSLAVNETTLDAYATSMYAYNELGSQYGYSGDLEQAFNYMDMPYNMRSAMYAGILSSSATPLPLPPYSCPSGNCTWDPFWTLGVGVQCADITRQLTLQCTNYAESANAAFFSAEACSFVSTVGADNYTRSLVDNAQYRTLMVLQTADEVLYQMLDKTKLGPAWFDTIPVTPLISMVQWVKATSNIGGITTNYSSRAGGYDTSDPLNMLYVSPNTTFEAGRCFFSVDAQQISANVSNGLYSERIIKEMTTAENPIDWYTKVWNAVQYGTTPPSDLVIQPSNEIDFPIAKDQLTISAYNYVLLQSQMLLLFVPSGYNSFFGYNPLLFTSNITGEQYGEIAGDFLSQMLFSTENVTDSMMRLAHYISVQLRTNDTMLLRSQTGDESIIAPDQAVRGTVWVQQVTIVVRWYWLTIPAFVLVLAVVFLCITVSRSNLQRVGIWKTSPLALLLHADCVSKLSGHEPLPTIDAMEEVAKNLNVEMDNTMHNGYAAHIRKNI